MPGSPYSPQSYRRDIARPKSRFSANERRKKQGDNDFWSSIGSMLPGIGGVAGGVIGGIAGGPAGATLGASLGGAAGSGIGSFATNHALSGQRELDEDTQQQDLLYAALADFYRSGGA